MKKIKNFFHMNEESKDVMVCGFMGICFLLEMYALIWFVAIIKGMA